jgi:universal stress protein A
MRRIMTNSETIGNSAHNEGLHLAASDAHFARIMVATDFSAPAAMALKMAIAIGEIFDSEILLVHAVAPFVYATGDGPIMPEMINAALDNAKEDMKQLVASDERLNRLRVKTVVACSSAIELIEQIASEHKVNLIVAGSNGASGLERRLLGSVAETILRKAACPVLIAGPVAVPNSIHSGLFCSPPILRPPGCVRPSMPQLSRSASMVVSPYFT